MNKPAGSEEPLGQDLSSLIQKQISRRGLLKGGLLAGLGIPTASTVLCSTRQELKPDQDLGGRQDNYRRLLRRR